jgi:glutamine synthetase
MRTLEEDQAKALQHKLKRAGVRLVVGTAVNSAGLVLAKSVPIERLTAFHRAGMGAADVWHVFCIDGEIAVTDSISAVGDQRLRIDLEAVKDLGEGLAWAPAGFFTQTEDVDPRCARNGLGAVESRLAAEGLTARVGHEVEFVLVARDGSALTDTSWTPYGVSGLLDREAVIADIVAAAERAGIVIEQVHAEYGRNQFELSLPPAGPVEAADSVVLVRLLIGRVARRHQLQVSFSPLPFTGSVGCGAHQHFSLLRDGAPLFDLGTGPHGLTGDGGRAIGGLVRTLPDVQGLLTGSVLSGERLKPGLWSGAHLGWGLENREVAVRLLQGGPGNPHGGNVEVKIADPSANVYTASAAILASALDGITSRAPLPEEVTTDPSSFTDDDRRAAGLGLISGDIAAVIDRLDASRLSRQMVGDAIVDATVATRRHELTRYRDVSLEEKARLFRLAWSC